MMPEYFHRRADVKQQARARTWPSCPSSLITSYAGRARVYPIGAMRVQTQPQRRAT